MTNYGNVARYVWHSCEPSAYMEFVARGPQGQIEELSRREQAGDARVVVRAARPLKAGHEITLNLFQQLTSCPDKAAAGPGRKKVYDCECGSATCLGVIRMTSTPPIRAALEALAGQGAAA